MSRKWERKEEAKEEQEVGVGRQGVGEEKKTEHRRSACVGKKQL
jgi:hypothetical protein